MNSNLFGISDKSDPKSIDLKNITLSTYDKKMLSAKGFDHGRKLTKKARKGFAYESLVNDSLYFEAYKNFTTCVEKATEKGDSLTEGEMEAACGQEFKRLRVMGISGQLRYPNVNSPFFSDHIASESGFR